MRNLFYIIIVATCFQLSYSQVNTKINANEINTIILGDQNKKVYYTTFEADKEIRKDALKDNELMFEVLQEQKKLGVDVSKMLFYIVKEKNDLTDSLNVSQSTISLLTDETETKDRLIANYEKEIKASYDANVISKERADSMEFRLKELQLRYQITKTKIDSRNYLNDKYGPEVRINKLLEEEKDKQIAFSFKGGFAIVKEEDQYNYMSANGNLLFEEFRFQDAQPFTDGIAKVVEGGTTYFINGKGKRVSERISTKASNLLNGKIFIEQVENHFAYGFPFLDIAIYDKEFSQTGLLSEYIKDDLLINIPDTDSLRISLKLLDNVELPGKVGIQVDTFWADTPWAVSGAILVNVNDFSFASFDSILGINSYMFIGESIGKFNVYNDQINEKFKDIESIYDFENNEFYYMVIDSFGRTPPRRVRKPIFESDNGLVVTEYRIYKNEEKTLSFEREKGFKIVPLGNQLFAITNPSIRSWSNEYVKFYLSDIDYLKDFKFEEMSRQGDLLHYTVGKSRPTKPNSLSFFWSSYEGISDLYGNIILEPIFDSIEIRDDGFLTQLRVYKKDKEYLYKYEFDINGTLIGARGLKGRYHKHKKAHDELTGE